MATQGGRARAAPVSPHAGPAHRGQQVVPIAASRLALGRRQQIAGLESVATLALGHREAQEHVAALVHPSLARSVWIDHGSPSSAWSPALPSVGVRRAEALARGTPVNDANAPPSVGCQTGPPMSDTDAAGGPPSTDRPQTSTRSHDEVTERLSAWLAARPGTTHGVVSDLAAPSTNGMSSETLLFDAEWTDADGEHHERCVARLEPEASAVPVFPTYDLELQHRVMTLVGERTSVPVPRNLWFEPDPEPVGSPFIVMGRVDGVVPPDVMPYPFGDNWLFDADPVD